jgi:hypothetical protein
VVLTGSGSSGSWSITDAQIYSIQLEVDRGSQQVYSNYVSYPA